MLVSRYDRTMAAAIVAPVLEGLPERFADVSGIYFERSRLVQPLAAYDPRAVTALLRDLPASARRPPEKPVSWNAASVEAQVRLGAAQVLALPAEERWPLVFAGNSPLRVFRRVR